MHYWVHGVELASEVPLTARPSAGGVAGLAVRLDPAASIPRHPAAGTVLLWREADQQTYSITREASGQHCIRFGQLADFTLSPDLSSCIVTPDERSAPGYAEVLLIGNVLAAVLALQGEATLHASAVLWQDVGIAFAGPSHAGKTRLASALCQLGAKLIADDTLRVGVGRATAKQWPGSTALRLRGHLAPAPADWTTARSVDERTLAFPPGVAGVQPLHHVCVLRPTPGPPALRPLRGSLAFAHLHASMRITGWSGSQQVREQFEAIRQLFPKVVVWELAFDPREAPSEALLDRLFEGLVRERQGGARSAI
jgi:hypothetical protein